MVGWGQAEGRLIGGLDGPEIRLGRPGGLGSPGCDAGCTMPLGWSRCRRPGPGVLLSRARADGKKIE